MQRLRGELNTTPGELPDRRPRQGEKRGLNRLTCLAMFGEAELSSVDQPRTCDTKIRNKYSMTYGKSSALQNYLCSQKP